jgi:hypothetical protein
MMHVTEQKRYKSNFIQILRFINILYENSQIGTPHHSKTKNTGMRSLNLFQAHRTIQ